MTLLAALAGALHLAPLVLAADPSAPTLLFNWTLNPWDAPVLLSNLPADWTIANTTGGGVSTTKITNWEVEFMGSGLAFHGASTGWNQVGSNGLPEAAGAAFVTGDSSWDDIKNRDLFKPASDTTIWERSTPRFQRYTMGLAKSVSDVWTLQSAEVMTGMNSSAATLADVPKTEEPFVNATTGELNPFYNLTGRWEVVNATESATASAKCYDKGLMRIDIPAETAFVTMHGIRTTIAPNMYFQLFANGNEATDSTWVTNAKYLETKEGLFWMTPLDPSVAWTLVYNCVFTADQGEQLVTSMTFYKGNGTTTGGSFTTGRTGGSSTGGSASTPSSSSGTSGTANPSTSSGKSGASANQPMMLSTGAIIIAAVGLSLL